MALSDVFRTEQGKTWILDAMKKSIPDPNGFNKICGREFTNVWIDEWGGFEWPKLLAGIKSFKDPNWPAADVEVEEEILRPSDPRHPNPKAGAIKEYIIIAGGRRSRSERTLTVALINAENLHKRMVAALQKDIDDQLSVNPTYGMF